MKDQALWMVNYCGEQGSESAYLTVWEHHHTWIC